MPNVIEIGATVFKCIKNKQTNKETRFWVALEMEMSERETQSSLYRGRLCCIVFTVPITFDIHDVSGADFTAVFKSLVINIISDWL
jgi:hypothetical protein